MRSERIDSLESKERRPQKLTIKRVSWSSVPRAAQQGSHMSHTRLRNEKQTRKWNSAIIQSTGITGGKNVPKYEIFIIS